MFTVVLMTSRSGSSMVCRVLAEHGARWQDGLSDPSQNKRGDGCSYRTFEHPYIKGVMRDLAPNRKWPLGEMVEVTNWHLDLMKKKLDKVVDTIDFVKVGVEFVDLWHQYFTLLKKPINFIKVYRLPQGVADSFERRSIGEWQVGYDIACKRYRLMDDVTGVWVDTNELALRNYTASGIEFALTAAGFRWNKDMIDLAVNSEKFHVS